MRPAVVHLREERAKPFSQLDERTEAAELLGGDRWEVHRVADDAVAEEIAERGRRLHAHQLLAFTGGRGDVRRGDDLRQHLQAGVWRRLDRKSTRLNSSHGYSSYAVFCLK